MELGSTLRNLDRRAVAAVVVGAVPLAINVRSTSESSVDGVQSTCSSTNYGALVGAVIIVVLLGSLLMGNVGSPRRSSATLATAGLAAALGVLQVVRGFGGGGPCDDAVSLTLPLVLVGLAAAVWLVVVVSGSERPAATAAAVSVADVGPDLSAGVKRCRACSFSSNPSTAGECRHCGSSDLELVGRITQ